MQIEKMTLLVSGAALLVGLGGGYVLANTAKYGMMRHENKDSHAGHQINTQQTDENRTMSNRPGHGMHHANMLVSDERSFLEGMIPHHEEAVVVSRELLARNITNETVRTLAEGIIVAQEKEITDMKTWYQNWYGVPYVASGAYQPMMRSLATVSDEQLVNMYLEDMIMHHQGALMMAASVQGNLNRPELISLTQTILTTQTEEINMMKNLLQS